MRRVYTTIRQAVSSRAGLLLQSPETLRENRLQRYYFFFGLTSPHTICLHFCSPLPIFKAFLYNFNPNHRKPTANDYILNTQKAAELHENEQLGYLDMSLTAWEQTNIPHSYYLRNICFFAEDTTLFSKDNLPLYS